MVERAVGSTQGAIVALSGMISDGRLPPGSRLPVEAELCTALGVSRPSLREAVRALSFAGALDVRQGDGTYVAASDPARVFGGLGLLSAAASGQGLEAVVEARRIVEPQLTSLAAARATDEDIAALEHELERMEQAGSVEDLVEADLAFHRGVADAARSPVLQHFLNNLASETVRARIWHGVEVAERNQAAIQSHRAILRAIRQRDPYLAEAEALAHIAPLADWLSSKA